MAHTSIALTENGGTGQGSWSKPHVLGANGRIVIASPISQDQIVIVGEDPVSSVVEEHLITRSSIYQSKRHSNSVPVTGNRHH